jgi:hypothetical protein
MRRLVVALAFCATVLSVAEAGSGTALSNNCSCKEPVVRAGVYNLNLRNFVGEDSEVFLLERAGALSVSLTSDAILRDLDVLCLTDLSDNEIRDVVLPNLNSSVWSTYHPPNPDQPGCRDACLDTSLDPNRYPPANQRIQACSLSLIPNFGISCSDLTGLAFQQCVIQFCPDLVSYYNEVNPQCSSCIFESVDGESVRDRTLKCSSVYNKTSAGNCKYTNGGDVGELLLSRYPFVATDYRPFTLPSNPTLLANRGIVYGKIQTPSGQPVHLFCSSFQTSKTLGTNATIAEQMNLAQSREVLAYMQEKAQGEVAVLMASTGSGPAVIASPTGPANAEWLFNFQTLANASKDALLSNIGDNLQTAPVAACTFDCNNDTTLPGRYVDHIFTTGQGKSSAGIRLPLCHRRGGLFLDQPFVRTNQGTVRASRHIGVRTDVCLIDGCPASGRIINDKCCRNDFVCPPNSYRLPNRQCYDTFNDCACDRNFVKQEDKCTACRNTYVCPANSRRIPNRNCYSSFDDCTCDSGFVKRGNRCEKCRCKDNDRGRCNRCE